MGLYFTGNILGGTQQALSSTLKSIVTVIGAASSPRRSKVYEIACSHDGTPSDIPVTWDLSRMTADDGTKTNVTPTQINPADAACSGLSRANFTAEGTVTATSSLFEQAPNVRSTIQWLTFPEYGLVAPATAGNGFTLRAKSTSYTGTVLGSLRFEE